MSNICDYTFMITKISSHYKAKRNWIFLMTDLGFCLMAQIEVQWVQWVQISPISPISGKKSCGILPSRQRFGGRALIRGRCPRLLKVVPSRHRSACGVLSVIEQELPQDRIRPIRGRIRLSRGKGIYLCLMASWHRISTGDPKFIAIFVGPQSV